MGKERLIWGHQLPSDRKGDLHVHSKWTKGFVKTDGMSSPSERVEQAVKAGHNFLALVDHDNIGPSIEAHEYARTRHDIEIPEGCAEVTCRRHDKREAHLLGYGMNDNIQFDLSVAEAVIAIHEAGGYAVAPHPLCNYAHGIGKSALLEIASSEESKIYWDGVEGFNGIAHDWRFALKVWEDKNPNTEMINIFDENQEVVKFRFGILTGGSDDHNGHVGRVITKIPEEKTVFQAFDEQVRTAVVLTGGRGDYSPKKIWSQIVAGSDLSHARSLIDVSLSKFPV